MCGWLVPLPDLGGAGMTDCGVSHREAVLLWDAILDLKPSANPLVGQLPVSAGKIDQEEMTTMDPYIEDPFEREMAAIEAHLDEAEAILASLSDT